MSAPRIAFICLLLAAAPAADASLGGAARYDLSIGGIPIGEAQLRARVEGARYEIAATADVGFLFWGGEGEARAFGAALVAPVPDLAPEAYRLAYQGVTRPGAVEIDFLDGRAARHLRTPPIPPEYAANRVEIAPAHLEGVRDPLSAFVAPAPADIDPDALCRRVLPVFNGYVRFDIVLEGALDAAPAADGAVACAARYAPVSGHRADSEGVARLRRPGALSVSLSPLAPGLWGPHAIAVETRFGPFRLERR
ncbi:MAG: DUF3108 domain-containing protein [Rubrimonas sp.]|uniref:DUF3108 domain-containing protein n=1 Tax=Rubrimonas sp. TaxID=2036015 RepID=UPI002FDCB83C